MRGLGHWRVAYGLCFFLPSDVWLLAPEWSRLRVRYECRVCHVAQAIAFLLHLLNFCVWDTFFFEASWYSLLKVCQRPLNGLIKCQQKYLKEVVRVKATFGHENVWERCVRNTKRVHVCAFFFLSHWEIVCLSKLEMKCRTTWFCDLRRCVKMCKACKMYFHKNSHNRIDVSLFALRTLLLKAWAEASFDCETSSFSPPPTCTYIQVLVVCVLPCDSLRWKNGFFPMWSYCFLGGTQHD